jgi:ABC-2 type transport system ATP-binding protein
MGHRASEASLNTPRAPSPGGRGTPDDAAPPVADAAAALTVRSLAKSFHAGVVGCSARVDALRGVDLDVIAGEALGILGPAGAGKSTLLLCLAGMLRPDAGTITWFGRVADEAGRPPGIAYVSHRATPYPFLSVLEAIEHHAMLHDVPAADRGAAVQEALDDSRLAREAHASVGDLSRSAVVRLALAQALVARPRLLLLDDPLAGLGSAARLDFAVITRTLLGRGTTLVIAADEIDAIDVNVARVAVMLDGTIATIVPTSALRRSRALEITVATPARARQLLGDRVAEPVANRHVLRLPLEGTSAEAILARFHACGIRVETSRIVIVHDRSREEDDDRPMHHG